MIARQLTQPDTNKYYDKYVSLSLDKKRYYQVLIFVIIHFSLVLYKCKTDRELVSIPQQFSFVLSFRCKRRILTACQGL